MAGAVVEKLRWMYVLVAQELTVKSLCIYGSIFLLSWLFSKLFVFPSLSPLNKVCIIACVFSTAKSIVN
jgi:hypothetical protein